MKQNRTKKLCDKRYFSLEKLSQCTIENVFILCWKTFPFSYNNIANNIFVEKQNPEHKILQ